MSDLLPDSTLTAAVVAWGVLQRFPNVSLATQLVHDAWSDLFDVALLLSKDIDLIEPVLVVGYESADPVGIVVLDGKAPWPARRLRNLCASHRHTRPAAAQFVKYPFRSAEKGKKRTMPSRVVLRDKPGTVPSAPFLIPLTLHLTPIEVMAASDDEPSKKGVRSTRSRRHLLTRHLRFACEDFGGCLLSQRLQTLKQLLRIEAVYSMLSSIVAYTPTSGNDDHV